MGNHSKQNSHELAEHFFRNEYGKLVAVITKYVGLDDVKTAEDIVQETLLKAVDHWNLKGVPQNPQAWLYTTAKNTAITFLKRKKYENDYIQQNEQKLDELIISDELIRDEQLKMMFVCCGPSIPNSSQIALILKILCGFSIKEIANAFFTTNETINKRLVRGRKSLKSHLSLDLNQIDKDQLIIVEQTIYLLFNEGYSPTQKNDIVRLDLCIEAIRLAKIIDSHKAISSPNTSALLALMYFNASRFESRIGDDGEVIEMKHQDRGKWNSDMINEGIHYLNQSMQNQVVSKYLVLAAISAQHCIAPNYESTDWKAILSLYDDLIKIEDTPIIRLNRSVAIAEALGYQKAIDELLLLKNISSINSNHLYHSALSEYYINIKDTKKATSHLSKAITLSDNERDKKLLQKKLTNLVPIP